jgi:hypothetical protein
MAKSGITWKGVFADGEERQVSADRVGGEWAFHERSKRFENWRLIAKPSLEDWLELLDGVRRRIGRGLMHSADEKMVLRRLRERFPKAEIPPRR